MFWETDQKDIILPSLVSLAPNPNSSDMSRVLFDLLNSTDNVCLPILWPLLTFSMISHWEGSTDEIVDHSDEMARDG